MSMERSCSQGTTAWREKIGQMTPAESHQQQLAQGPPLVEKVAAINKPPVMILEQGTSVLEKTVKALA